MIPNMNESSRWSTPSSTAVTTSQFIAAGAFTLLGAVTVTEAAGPLPLTSDYVPYGYGQRHLISRPRWVQSEPTVDTRLGELAISILQRQKRLDPDIELILAKNMHFLYE